MVNISPAERNLCSRRREALLYIAGRFMAVRIDYCAKRRASSHKRASAQARTKPQAASDKLQAPSHKLQAPGPRSLDKVSGRFARGSRLR